MQDAILESEQDKLPVFNSRPYRRWQVRGFENNCIALLVVRHPFKKSEEFWHIFPRLWQSNQSRQAVVCGQVRPQRVEADRRMIVVQINQNHPSLLDVPCFRGNPVPEFLLSVPAVCIFLGLNLKPKSEYQGRKEG